MSRLARSYPDQPEMWANPPVPPARPRRRCRCGHGHSLHYQDRKGRPTCGSAVCGCLSYRPAEEAS